MNLENYLSEQSLLIKNIIKDLKKVRKSFENLKSQKEEVKYKKFIKILDLLFRVESQLTILIFSGIAPKKDSKKVQLLLQK